MKMEQSSRKTLKLGTYTLIVCAVALAIVIFANFLVGILPSSVTALEISGQNLFDLSETTVKICEGLKEDVTLYFVTYEGSEDGYLNTLLERYSDLSSHILVKKIDPRTNPGFIDEYVEEGELTTNQNFLICKSAKRFRVLDYYEIYTYSEELQQNIYYYYQQTGQYPENVSPDTFQGEIVLTGAIDYVTSDVLPTVYALNGNKETALNDSIKALVEKENIQIADLNLLENGAVPDDADAVFLYRPTQDLTEIETDALTAYAEKGGKILLCSMWSTLNGETMPNFCAFLETFGVRPVDGLVCESGNNFYYVNYLVFPILNPSSAVIQRIGQSSNVLMSNAQFIEKTGAEGVTVESILTSSDGSYARMDLDAENPDLAKKEDDPAGPLLLGAAATRAADGAVLYWYSSCDVGQPAGSFTPQGNVDLFLETLIVMTDKENSVTAGEQRSLAVEPLTVTESDATIWGALLIGVVPLIFIICGIVIFVKRRRK